MEPPLLHESRAYLMFCGFMSSHDTRTQENLDNKLITVEQTGKWLCHRSILVKV